MISSLIWSFIFSVVICLVAGMFTIPYLRKLKFGQSIRECGPQEHLKKAGTPTMGGLIMFPAIILPVIIFADINKQIVLALLLLVGYGLIGFADDYIKIVLKRNLGLTSKQKLLAQGVIAATFLFFSDWSAVTKIPFLNTDVTLDGFFYCGLVVLLLLGTTNAVNLTDGLDGLASGATVPVAFSYLAITLYLKEYSLAILAVAIAGTCLAFLAFNHKPAQVFMGDTGSLALGGGISALALLTNTQFFLVIIGGLYVIEALSVILQVISFKTFGKRIFRMSPLHHHFELLGWSETKVVKVFWFISLVFSLAGYLLWLK